MSDMIRIIPSFVKITFLSPNSYTYAETVLVTRTSTESLSTWLTFLLVGGIPLTLSTMHVGVLPPWIAKLHWALGVLPLILLEFLLSSLLITSKPHCKVSVIIHKNAKILSEDKNVGSIFDSHIIMAYKRTPTSKIYFWGSEFLRGWYRALSLVVVPVVSPARTSSTPLRLWAPVAVPRSETPFPVPLNMWFMSMCVLNVVNFM